jgi:hypothetical protein
VGFIALVGGAEAPGDYFETTCCKISFAM